MLTDATAANTAPSNVVQLICADTSSDALSDCAFVSLDVKGDQ
jgi:hypothetical protein